MAGLAALALLSPLTVAAQSYPSRPVHVVVPFAPGGAADAIARQISLRLADLLNQPFVIDNRPGADSALGATYVARAVPDGYTLLFSTDATFVLNPLLFTSLPYKPSRDFEPVATVAYLNLVLVVNGDLPPDNFKEFVSYTKENSGKISYGSPGVGSQGHIMGEAYKKLTDTDIVHVPYKGVAPALTDLIGGQIAFAFPSISTIKGFLADGKLKALAISGSERSALLPGVPTFTEVGFKEMDIGAWYAFLAPAGTPKNIVAKLNAAVAAVLAQTEVQKDFTNRGMQSMNKSPDEFAAFMRSESSRMASIIKSSGAKVE